MTGTHLGADRGRSLSHIHATEEGRLSRLVVNFAQTGCPIGSGSLILGASVHPRAPKYSGRPPLVGVCLVSCMRISVQPRPRAGLFSGPPLLAASALQRERGAEEPFFPQRT